MDYKYLSIIAIGVIFLIIGLSYSLKIMRSLEGRLKAFWALMSALILFFIFGYCADIIFEISAWAAKGHPAHHLTIALVFFSGGVFVLFITHISFNTIESVKKIGRLTYEAERDPLTNLYNRRYFEKAAELLFSQMKRTPSLSSVLLFLDINKFKSINDNLGHLVGDAILREIAAVISSRIRKTDIAARFGGDEFVVLLYSTSIEDAKAIVMHMVKSMDERCHHLFPQVIQACPQAGCAVGITVLNHEKENLQQVIDEADKACYQAKQMGNGYHVAVYDQDGVV